MTHGISETTFKRDSHLSTTYKIDSANKNIKSLVSIWLAKKIWTINDGRQCRRQFDFFSTMYDIMLMWKMIIIRPYVTT